MRVKGYTRVSARTTDSLMWSTGVAQHVSPPRCGDVKRNIRLRLDQPSSWDVKLSMACDAALVRCSGMISSCIIRRNSKMFTDNRTPYDVGTIFLPIPDSSCWVLKPPQTILGSFIPPRTPFLFHLHRLSSCRPPRIWIIGGSARDTR